MKQILGTATKYSEDMNVEKVKKLEDLLSLAEATV